MVGRLIIFFSRVLSAMKKYDWSKGMDLLFQFHINSTIDEVMEKL